MEVSLDSEHSQVRKYFIFMPTGDFLFLGHVLWNYMHHLIRLVRDLLYIEPPTHLINHSIGPTVLNKEQLDDRK